MLKISVEKDGVLVTPPYTVILDETLFSGQAFRWRRSGENEFKGITCRGAITLCQVGESILFKGITEDEFQGFWLNYFDLDSDYTLIRNTVQCDNNVCRALSAHKGIVIMRQPFWETLISFIISANNNIPRISSTIERLSRAFGEAIEGEDYLFPTPKALAEADIEALRACGVGYRDAYIKSTAQKIASGEFCPEALRGMTRLEARKALCTLQGVGEKVADCILLFSLGFEDAFPIDVWVKRTMSSLYFEGEQISNRAIEQKVREIFPKWSGYAQQVLFHWMRTGT